MPSARAQAETCRFELQRHRVAHHTLGLESLGEAFGDMEQFGRKRVHIADIAVECCLG
ncbi:hypothetical protein D3C72_2281150 [compost metagenome]